MGLLVQISKISHGCPRNWILFYVSQSADGTQHTIDDWGLLRKKTVVWTRKDESFPKSLVRMIVEGLLLYEGIL